MSSLRVVGGRPLRGRLRVPGDKSISHRALILAALAEGTSVIRGLSAGADVARTRRAVEAMGAVVEHGGGARALAVTGGRDRLREPADVLDMGNSGTGIRLLAGLCAGLPWLSVLTGDESVRNRPMARVAEPLREMGAVVDGRVMGTYPPLAVRGGRLRGVDYRLPVASAQVKSAVLLAGLAAEGDTVVRQQVVTRAHTEEMLLACGADIEVSDDGLVVRLRPGPLAPFEADVPGDPSQAAFWLVAASIVPGSDLVVEDLYSGPARTGFVDVLRRMGADVTADAGGLRARYSPELAATSVAGAEVADVIDEIPVLAVAAARARGETRFTDAAELRVKESDRIAATTAALGALGARVEAAADGLCVHGPSRLVGSRADARGDHRIAMALAVAGLAAEGETTIDGWDSVATSYPGFEDQLEALCGS